MAHATNLRTSPALVKEIIFTTLSEEEVKPFLDAANHLVSARLTGQYSDTILMQIEKHLAAHFITGRDPAVKSETIGEAAITYFTTSVVGEGLASSPHGQKVQMFDYKGLLSKNKGVVDIEAYG